MNIFDLTYEGERYLVLFRKDEPLYLIHFESDGCVGVYQDIFPISIGNMIGALLNSGNISQAGIELFKYMEEHDTEGSSTSGISSKKELSVELAECYLPAVDQIAEICGLI